MTAAPPIEAKKLPARDPRFARPLPWSSPDGNAFHPFGRPLLMIHGVLLSLVLVIFPAYILYYLV